MTTICLDRLQTATWGRIPILTGVSHVRIEALTRAELHLAIEIDKISNMNILFSNIEEHGMHVGKSQKPSRSGKDSDAPWWKLVEDDLWTFAARRRQPGEEGAPEEEDEEEEDKEDAEEEEKEGAVEVPEEDDDDLDDDDLDDDELDEDELDEEDDDEDEDDEDEDEDEDFDDDV